MSASGSTLLSHVDRLTASDVDTMTSALTGQTYTCSSRLQLSLIGSFQDSKNVSQSLLIPILGEWCCSRFLGVIFDGFCLL